MTLSEIKTALRYGPYAWPGGYPTFFITADGGCLSHDTVIKEWRSVVSAHLTGHTASGWYVDGQDINWEDGELRDDHTSERIESAYAD